MSDLGTTLAREVVQRLTGSGVIAEMLADGLGSAFTRAVSLADERSSGTAFSELLGLGDPERPDAIANLADALAAAVPTETLRRIEALLHPEREHPSPGGTDPDEKTGSVSPTRTWDAVLATVRREDPATADRLAQAVAGMSAAFDAMAPYGAMMVPRAGLGAAATGGGRWNPERVTRMMRELMDAWTKAFPGGLLGRHVTAAASEIQAEMQGSLQARVLLAGAMSVAGLSANGLESLADQLLQRRSTMRFGAQVHDAIERDYRSAQGRQSHVVIHESNVRAGGVSRPISQVWSTWPTDDLAALYLARDRWLIIARKLASAQGEVDRDLRSDVIDLTVGRIWEIKPIRSAGPGVLQEFFYRSAYNMYAALLQDVAIVRVASGRITKPVGFLSEKLFAGTPAAWPESRASLTVANGETVIVLSLEPLPGLVFYVRPDLATAATVVLAIWIRTKLEELLRDLKTAAKVLAESLATALLLVLAILVVAAILILATAGALAAAAVVVVAGATLSDRSREGLAALDRDRADSGGEARLDTVTLSGDGRLILRFTPIDPDAEGPPATAPEARRCRAQLGPLVLEEVPVAWVARFEPTMVVATAVAGDLLRSALSRENGPAVS